MPQNNVLQIAGKTPARQACPITLQLEPYKDSVRLVAVDECGDRLPDGNLLKVMPDGTVYFYKTVNPELGFRTDYRGKLQVTDTNPHSKRTNGNGNGHRPC